MNLPNTSEADLRELGGEPLKKSGVESESSSSAFGQFEQQVEEASGR